jgi:uncharacterized membrane protein YfcA
MDLSTLDHLAVIAAGFGAGVVAASVGVASLVSFPVLVALGLPPVTANASNTVGLVPGGLSGSFGYRHELKQHPKVTAAVVATSALGAIAGAVLLLALSPDVFEALVPWLILFACLLVGFQPQHAAGIPGNEHFHRLRLAGGVLGVQRRHVAVVLGGIGERAALGLRGRRGRILCGSLGRSLSRRLGLWLRLGLRLRGDVE